MVSMKWFTNLTPITFNEYCFARVSRSHASSMEHPNFSLSGHNELLSSLGAIRNTHLKHIESAVLGLVILFVRTF